MKNYELIYLANPDISEEESEELSKKITGFIVEEKGSILKSKTEKRRLGHEVKGKKEAYLVSVVFSAEPENIKNLGKMIDSEENILRKILIVKILQKEVPAEAEIARENPSPKVELEKIDEKIDEILK